MFKLLGDESARGRQIELAPIDPVILRTRLAAGFDVFAFRNSARRLRQHALNVSHRPLTLTAGLLPDFLLRLAGRHGGRDSCAVLLPATVRGEWRRRLHGHWRTARPAAHGRLQCCDYRHSRQSGRSSGADRFRRHRPEHPRRSRDGGLRSRRRIRDPDPVQRRGSGNQTGFTRHREDRRRSGRRRLDTAGPARARLRSPGEGCLPGADCGRAVVRVPATRPLVRPGIRV